MRNSVVNLGAAAADYFSFQEGGIVGQLDDLGELSSSMKEELRSLVLGGGSAGGATSYAGGDTVSTPSETFSENMASEDLAPEVPEPSGIPEPVPSSSFEDLQAEAGAAVREKFSGMDAGSGKMDFEIGNFLQENYNEFYDMLKSKEEDFENKRSLALEEYMMENPDLLTQQDAIDRSRQQSFDPADAIMTSSPAEQYDTMVSPIMKGESAPAGDTDVSGITGIEGVPQDAMMDIMGYGEGGVVDLGAGSPEEMGKFLDFLRKNRPVYREGDERSYTYYSDMLMVPEEKRNTPEQEYETLPRADLYGKLQQNPKGFAEPSYGITLEDIEKGVANLSDLQDEAETGNPYAGTSGNFVPQQYEIVDGSVIANPVGFDDGGEVPVEEAGIGSFMYDMVTGNVPSDKYNAMRTSGRMDDPMAQAIYGQDPTFMERLVKDYDYPANIPMQDDQGYAIMDPETGGQKMMMATDFNLPEYMRTGRPRPDMPTYGELEDARAHALASALMAKDYGPRTTGIATKIKEATEMLPGFGSSGFRDMKMDNRNNALGVKLLKEAGIQTSPKELARIVDQAVFSQLDRILGRSEDRQDTPAKDQPFAKQYFKSPEGGLDVYFPRDKQGYFDTSYIYD